MTSYVEFLASKRKAHRAEGIDDASLPEYLFPWQADVVRWALRKGRACLFEGTGLGKTIQQLVWADRVCDHTGGPVLVLAPLAVADQTVAEAARFGIEAEVRRDGGLGPRVTVTNYEQMHRYDFFCLAGVVLDESSILKAHDGKTRTALIEQCQEVPFRLACTATPAPNDVTELCNHAEFVGAMSRTEMLTMYFVHDGGSTQDWRLKGHAVEAFWRWVATWAAMIQSPADIGHDPEGYDLPPLTIREHILDSGIEGDALFVMPAKTMTEQRSARKQTLAQRVSRVASLASAEPDEPWVVWCELNAESEALAAAIPGAVEVTGSMADDEKRRALLDFGAGRIRVLVSKPRLAGFGMNWQHCARQAFVGPSHSWEQFYQAVRRCWRFGQTRPVDVHVVTTDAEVEILHNLQRKQAAADEMTAAMVGNMREGMMAEIGATTRTEQTHSAEVREGDGWRLHRGDCVDVWRGIEADSIHYTVFSPPFASLYTYTNSDRDMGNCADHGEFFRHFEYLVPELLRATMPGRLLSFHCMNLPTSKARDGYIGLTDFRGQLIEVFRAAGWIYHSEVCIWKDPVTAMQRTKALGLLHKQIRKDSAMSRQGIADYLVTMRKPGDNPEPVAHTAEQFPVQMWQRYASPIWTDINPSDTLQYRSAREHNDERHICPLQLGVIRRAVALWSNPGDLVASPFAGIGSEGYVALDMGRRFVGAEIKASYYEQACRNLASPSLRQAGLFDDIATDSDEAQLWRANS